MTSRKVFVSYDHEGDMLEVLWAFREGYFTPTDDIANVTVKEEAIRLGVSERRVRKLARDGRVRGAVKAGAEWLIPTPV